MRDVRYNTITFKNNSKDIAVMVDLLLRNDYVMRIWSDEMHTTIDYIDKDLDDASILFVKDNEYILSEEDRDAIYKDGVADGYRKAQREYEANDEQEPELIVLQP